MSKKTGIVNHVDRNKYEVVVYKNYGILSQLDSKSKLITVYAFDEDEAKIKAMEDYETSTAPEW